VCEREGERERDTRAHTHTSFVVFVGEFAQVIVLYARTYTHVIYCGIRCASDLNYTHTQLWDKRPNQRARGSPDPPGAPAPAAADSRTPAGGVQSHEPGRRFGLSRKFARVPARFGGGVAARLAGAAPRIPLGGLPTPRRPPRTVAHPRGGPKVTNRHSDHHDACLSFGQEAC